MHVTKPKQGKSPFKKMAVFWKWVLALRGCVFKLWFEINVNFL